MEEKDNEMAVTELFLKEKKKQKITNIVLVVVSVLALANMLVGFKLTKIDGTSMEPSLQHGEMGWQLKAGKWFVDVDDFAISHLVYKNLDMDIIKRVVALPGDTVKMDSGFLFVNGVLVDEDYIKEEPVKTIDGNYDEITLKEDEYFVLGDNRNNSADSRMFGPVKKESIKGILLK